MDSNAPTAAGAGDSGAGSGNEAGSDVPGGGSGMSSGGNGTGNRDGTGGTGGEDATGGDDAPAAGQGGARGEDAGRGGTISGRGSFSDGGGGDTGGDGAGQSGAAGSPEGGGGVGGDGAGTSGQTGGAGEAGDGGAAGAPVACCDDGNACTLDVCHDGLACEHFAARGSVEYVGEQPIIDDPTNNCFVLAEEEVIVSVSFADPGVVGDLGVTVDFTHGWIGDLDIEISHLDTRVLLVHMPPDGVGTNGGNAAGAYTFRDDAPELPTLADPRTITPGSYRPAEPLSAFRGLPIAGTWTLRIADHCPFDGGTFRAFSVAAPSACEGADGCEGLCDGGLCGCQ